jgi:hypothetical protein
MVAHVEYSMAGRSRGRVATRSAGFLVEPQNQGRRFCKWFGLKTTRTVFSGLASKTVAMVSSGLASKPAATVFSSLTLKLVATVSSGLTSKPVVGFLVELQNQAGGGFPDLGLKINTAVSWFGAQNQVSFGLSVAP